MIRKIMHRPQAVLGLAMMLLVFLVMLLAPVFAPNDPMQLNVAHSFAQPDAQYPLGTDELGRCILSRLIYGARGFPEYRAAHTAVAGGYQHRGGYPVRLYRRGAGPHI